MKKEAKIIRGVLIGIFFASIASIAIGSEEETKSGDQPKEQIQGKPHTHILTNEQLSAVVTIETTSDEGRGAGTGFIGRLKGVLFVFTNRHVIEGSKSIVVKTLNGSTIGYSHIFFAVDHDVAILRLSDQDSPVESLTINEHPISSTLLGEKIIVPGNSQGSGVLLQAQGKIIAFGPNRIEHNTPTYSGNSGSPILLQKNLEVIGVHTMSYKSEGTSFDWNTKAARKNPSSEIKSSVRKFGYRIDTVEKWTLVNLVEINKQREKMVEIAEGINAVRSLINGGSAHKKDDRITRAIDRMINDTTVYRMSEADKESAVRRFHFSIRSYIGNLKQEAKKYQSSGYEFYRDQFAELEKLAASIEEETNKRISRINLIGL